ncbi:hypothetical protein DFH08DRAFT_831772 [Mycena albidolilacea]|uniref:Uncharacterized protein n=1 Tax=Mycena albidolilacea TaxID=1033008 RepID=A0AAD7AV47_9AGAR|nr:hypothetical protein DFH08DRAFT_831772 [Mycena albidolilacea]
MSTAHLPSYAAPLQPSFSRTPSYSAEPGIYEQRLALNARSLPQATGNFTKSSRSGNAKLRLIAQENNIDLPVYGSGGIVEGTVELTKTENISTVELRVEGRLELKEIAEGGHTDTTLCLDTVLLWIKDSNNPVCPSVLPFSLTLPTTFQYEGRSYPLPPSHSIKLKGLPGFYATIDYSVSAIINKPHSVPNLVPLVKSKKLGINIGSTTVSTPFIYYPRTRPAVPIPAPLRRFEGGFIESPEWRVYKSILKANAKAGAQDIYVKFYVPASRIFCASQAIPFHITFESTAFSLAAFLPYGPTTGGNSGKLRATRVQLMRQSTVDVRGTTIHGTKTDIWRVDRIGEGGFRHAGDGATWISFSGEIPIDPVKVTGFRVAGFSVMDCILFTVTPPDVTKSAFVGIRETIPVRLTTDAWSEDGRGIAAPRQSESFSVPPSPEDMPDAFEHAL